MGKLFDRIITISLNPALDVTLWIPSMDFNEPNKTTGEKLYAGGKAINIARVLSSLGEDAISLGVVGEDNSRMFTALLDQDHVHYDFIPVSGSIRENLTLVIPDRRVLKINRSGCAVSREAMDALKKRILTEMEGCESVLLVFAGSMPPNITPEAYKAFILSLKRPGARIAVDTSIFRAEDIEEISPFIIKPNLPEFRQMCGSSLPTEQSIIKSAQRMTGSVAHVLVSLGGKGLLYVNDSHTVRIMPDPVEVRSTIGAGDTTLAAFIYGLQQGMEAAEAAVFGAAAGTASVMLDGTEVVTLEQVKERLSAVTSKTVR